MGFIKLSNPGTTTTIQFAGDTLNKILDIITGVNIASTDSSFKLDINTETKFRDGKFTLADSDNSHIFTFDAPNLSADKLWTFPSTWTDGDEVLGRTTVQTVTGKVIDTGSNSITNIVNANISNSAAIVYGKLNLSGSIVNADIDTSAAIAVSKLAPGTEDYILKIVSGVPTWSEETGGGGGGAPTDAQYLTLATNGTLSDERVLTEGTGIDFTDGGAGSTLTVAIDSTVATLTGSQTLTNKTLTAPIIATISNSGTITLPTGTRTLVARDTTDTLTNKTLTAPIIATISNTGTLTLPTSTDTLVGRATTDTLTNKTLTAPIITTISNSGTITLPTGTRTLVARDTTDTLTNKTIDADGTGNSITNIENADIKAAAGIVTTKLADSSNFVLTTRTNTFGAFDQIFPSSRLLIGDSDASHTYTIAGSNLAANRTLTLPLLTGNDIVVTEAHTTTLTNKTISGSSNTLSNINYSSLTGTPPKLDDLSAPDDNTDLDASTGTHGLLPKLGGGTTNFLRADGSWAAPPSGGSLALDDLTDVNAPTPDADDVLTWDDVEGEWIAAAPPGSGGGESNTGSNVGSAGTGIFKQKVSTDLQFYKLNSTTNRLTIALDGTDKVDLTVNEANLSVAWSQLTSVPSTFTPSSHNHAASEITSGTLAVAQGGLNKSTITQHALLKGGASDTYSEITAGTEGYVLKIVSGTPAWAEETGGASELSDLSDVTVTTPSDGDLLVYDTDEFVNLPQSSLVLTYSQVDLSDSIVNADINSSAAIATSKLADGSSFVTLTGSQTLTNKTLTAPIIATISNSGTITIPTGTDTLVGRATTDTLTNKTLTAPVIATISNSGTITLPTGTRTLVARDTTDTLTNKTLTAPIIATISNTGTLTLPTSTDTLVGRATTDTLTNKTLTSPTINSPTLTNSGNTLTLPTTTDTLVGRATTDTLTNKTLTTPVISSISNSGTITLPTGTRTLVARDTTDTLTNKTLTSPIISTISNTGTLTLPTSTDTLVGRATTDTLTNKTLTSPVITGLDASTSAKGIVELALSTETTAGLAVQASDPRIVRDLYEEMKTKTLVGELDIQDAGRWGSGMFTSIPAPIGGSTGVASDDGMYRYYGTSTTQNTKSGNRTTNAILRRQYKPHLYYAFKIYNNSTNTSLFLGFSSASDASGISHTAPLANLSGIGLAALTGTTNYQIASNNGGATATLTDTGIAKSTALTTIEITNPADDGNWVINMNSGGYTGTITATVPAQTTALYAVWYIMNNDTTDRFLYIYRLVGKMTPP